jgi:MGT family glycosyltransferase
MTSCSIGHELKQRGYQVTLFSLPDSCAIASRTGLEFWEIGGKDYPLGSIPAYMAQLGRKTGWDGLQFTLNLFRLHATKILEEGPTALRSAQIDALLVDQLTPEGAVLADYFGVPYISICSALPMHRDATIPPPSCNRHYSHDRWSLLLNRMQYMVRDLATRPLVQLLNKYRRQWNLQPYSDLWPDSTSPYAQICQAIAEFDYPTATPQKDLHYTGPYINPDLRDKISFPFEQLTDQPLIYASLGTLQNFRQNIYQTIIQACDGLDCQLVLSLGKGMKPDLFSHTPGSPIIVDYAPQLELLSKASLTITHAGLTTVMESLNYAVPIVAIPITNDQPGVAARVVQAGLGEATSVNQLNVNRLRDTISSVLKNPSYRSRACTLQKLLQQSGGVQRAADVVESVIQTKHRSPAH